MKIQFVEIQNFRKLKSSRIDLSEKETIFVGANNSGKTSAIDAMIYFLKDKNKFSVRDFTLSNWKFMNEVGRLWTENANDDNDDKLSLDRWVDFLPSLDLWLDVEPNEIHYVTKIIPTLEWESGLLGIRLRLEPNNLEAFYRDYHMAYNSSKDTKEKAKNPQDKKEKTLKLWPNTMLDFLDRKLSKYFTVQAYILDPDKLKDHNDVRLEPQKLNTNNLPIEIDPLRGLIKVDVIYAQRGFSDSNASESGTSNLSSQLREYYTKHLDPFNQPTVTDVEALVAIDDAKTSFDIKLSESFKPSLGELESLNYPGFGNPTISISSRIKAIDGLDHSSAVLFNITKEDDPEKSLSLPEKHNGLGYQNLISMVFKLMRFRDDWMQVGKSELNIISGDEEFIFEPLHLVLIEEPEAHLHAQVQQVFIRKAYEVLRNHKNLEDKRFSTQMVVSTHSNHIAHEVNFASLRYFKRNYISQKEVPTSTVVNLSDTFGDKNETTRFATRYLKTTHCDLFFADAVILVEGSAEKIFVPHFIQSHFKNLATSFIAILEIGGSHAHRLEPLISTLGIITLIITDLDSVDSSMKAIRTEKLKNYKTGNSTLKKWLPKKENVDELLDLDETLKETERIKVSYQVPLNINLVEGRSEEICPYTFEDSLVFQNLSIFKTLQGNGLIKKINTALNNDKTGQEIAEEIFVGLRKIKKAEFALDLLFSQNPKKLEVPKYINDGLIWLEGKLGNKDNIIIK